MNLQHVFRIALLLPLFGFFFTANAQSTSRNYPFSWKETTDKWYQSKAFAYKFDTDGLTEKGGSSTRASHGPVCTNDCKESTAPDVCTATLVSEKLKDVELPGFSLPRGYSGVEYVTFDIQKNGKVGNYQVVKQAVLCKPCIQKAVNLVAELGEWFPADKEGNYAKSTVVVPVYFKR
ncbi:MAG: hypothetical protein GC192_22465 [Bacteroidetes bacterium]|nr:hypothetical protein [Bacteroidota bacterium]